jgi:deoxycytidylate deaminase
LFQRSVEVYLIRRLCLQAGVGAAIVEELDVLADPVSGFAD